MFDLRLSLLGAREMIPETIIESPPGEAGKGHAGSARVWQQVGTEVFWQSLGRKAVRSHLQLLLLPGQFCFT